MRWKKWLAVMLALLLLAATCLTLGNIYSEKKKTESGNIAYIGPTPALTTDKTVYKIGEPIMVTYTTDNLMDRICITLTSDVMHQIRWCYVGSGYDGNVRAKNNRPVKPSGYRRVYAKSQAFSPVNAEIPLLPLLRAGGKYSIA